MGAGVKSPQTGVRLVSLCAICFSFMFWYQTSIGIDCFQSQDFVKGSLVNATLFKDLSPERATNDAKARTEACFLTVQMAANGDFLEALQDMGQLGIRLPNYRYIVITNDESLNAKDWEKVVVKLDTKRHTKVKTHVTYAKFLAWKEDALASCRIVFVMDALNVPVNNATIWNDLETRARTSPGGLLAQLKPNRKTNLNNLQDLPSLHKETKENVQRTMSWLLSRPDYKNDTLCLWTNFFAYDPSNALYRAASQEFWELYSTEMLSARDQPLWSYMVEKHNLQPGYILTVPPESSELRPHVHVCAERQRQLCLLGYTEETNKCDADGRNQHVLLNVTDPFKIDCNKRKGGHHMSALQTFTPGP